jgi:hypothetical protein
MPINLSGWIGAKANRKTTRQRSLDLRSVLLRSNSRGGCERWILCKRYQMQHLFDFCCLLCKQGVGSSNLLTSTKHIHFNEIASKFSRQTPCSGGRCSPAEAHLSLPRRPLYFQGSVVLRSNPRSSIVSPLGPTRQSGTYPKLINRRTSSLRVARYPRGDHSACWPLVACSPQGRRNKRVNRLKVSASLAGCFRDPSWRRGARPPRTPRTRHPADPRILGDYKLAGAQRRLFEIWRIHRKDLPACLLLPQYPNRSHMRKLSAQARVVFLTNSEPHPIVSTFVILVAQYKDNLVVNVHCEAAKNGVGLGRQLRDRIKHELMRDNLAPLDREKRVVGCENWRIAIGLRHRTSHKGTAILFLHYQMLGLGKHRMVASRSQRDEKIASFFKFFSNGRAS